MTKHKRERKKTQGTEPNAFDFYNTAKEVQNRSGRSIGSSETEDCRFRDYFDVSVVIALLAWNMMITYGHLLADGTISHFLWALHFMKVCPQQDEGSAASGGSGGSIDPKPWRRYAWIMVYAILLFDKHILRERGSCFVSVVILCHTKTSLNTRLLFTDKF
jgi:hypothetical protein